MESSSQSLPQDQNALVLSKKKGQNWRSTEVEQLVKSWLDVAHDPAIGNEQTSDVFWGHVYDSYVTVIGPVERQQAVFQS
jgi:hypothetical protein